MKKSRGALFWVAVIGGPLVLCCGGGVAWLLWKGADFFRIAALPEAERAAALSDALSQVAVAETAAVDTFVAHVDAGRDSAAWGMTSAGWRSVTSQPQSDEFLGLIRRVMGRCLSKQLIHLNSRTVIGGPATTELVYNATFENGAGVIRVTTAAGAAGPEIHAFRVESPLFMEAAQRGAGMPAAPVPGTDAPQTPK